MCAGSGNLADVRGNPSNRSTGDAATALVYEWVPGAVLLGQKRKGRFCCACQMLHRTGDRFPLEDDLDLSSQIDDLYDLAHYTGWEMYGRHGLCTKRTRSPGWICGCTDPAQRLVSADQDIDDLNPDLYEVIRGVFFLGRAVLHRSCAASYNGWLGSRGSICRWSICR